MVLGPGAEILVVHEASGSASVTLCVRYTIWGSVHETSASGETIIDAHAALRRQLAADRLVHGFAAVAHGPKRQARG